MLEVGNTGFRILPIHIPIQLKNKNPIGHDAGGKQKQIHTVFLKKNETRQSITANDDKTLFIMNLPVTPFTMRSLYSCLTRWFSGCGPIQAIHLKAPKSPVTLSYSPPVRSDLKGGKELGGEEKEGKGEEEEEAENDDEANKIQLMRPGSFLYVEFGDDDAISRVYALNGNGAATYEWTASSTTEGLSALSRKYFCPSPK